MSEMELNIATKGRAASMDVRRGREAALRQSNASNKANQQANLPQIGGLPGIAAAANPTIG